MKRYKILVEINTNEKLGKNFLDSLSENIKSEITCQDCEPLIYQNVTIKYKQDFIVIMKNGNKLIMEADSLIDARKRAKGLFGDKLNKVVENIDDDTRNKI